MIKFNNCITYAIHHLVLSDYARVADSFQLVGSNEEIIYLCEAHFLNISVPKLMVLTIGMSDVTKKSYDRIEDLMVTFSYQGIFVRIYLKNERVEERDDIISVYEQK